MVHGLTTVIAILLFAAPALAQDRLPDGEVADGMGVRAWYAEPTERYSHGVLGDALEAGSLMVETNGHRLRFDLPADSVFEDLTPRIVDADGDGTPEILTVRSYLDRGATVALFQIVDGSLSLRAEADPIGTSHRWLNPSGVADYDGDGRPEIAVIRTPHIGGILILYRWDGLSDRLEDVARIKGYSTHSIGSRALGQALSLDWNGDGAMDLLLPRQDRKTLVALSMAGGVFTVIDEYRMRRDIVGNLELIGNFVKVPLKGGLNRTITRPYNDSEKSQ